MDAYWKEYVDFIKSKGHIEEVVIIASDTGALWASSDPDHFYLREYKAMITQEDGTEAEELVNEALNIVKFMKGEKPSQGLRINGGKKQQITRSFKDEATGLPVIYSKIPNGGACIANAGKCILVATFNEAKQHSSPECNDIVQLLAMYLCKSTWPDPLDDDLPGGGASADLSAVSWQSHVEKALLGRGNIAEAMIIAIDTGKILATSSPDFTLQVYQAEIAQEDGTDRNESVDEWKNLQQLMSSKRKPSQGLRVNQVKYQIVRSVEDETSTCYTVNGKKPLGGIAIATTGKVIVLATFDEKKQHTSPGCNENVALLAKYFKEKLK